MLLEEEVRKAVVSAIETGELLCISKQAETIAALASVDWRTACEALVHAAIAARVNVEFG